MKLNKTNLDNFTSTTLVSISLLSPTSNNNEVLHYLVGISYVIILFCTCINIFIYRTSQKPHHIITVFTIMLLYIFYTLYNPYVYELTDGAYLTRIVSTLFFLYTISANNAKYCERILYLLETLLFLQLISFLLDIKLLNSFMANFFDYYWIGLYENMVNYYKPVSVFALHSVAGFAFFLFSYVRLKQLIVLKKIKYAFLLCLYIVSLLALKSFTGIVFLIAILMLIFHHYRLNFKLWVLTLLAISAIILFFYEDLFSIFYGIINSNISGPQSRFTEGTMVYETIEYILDPLFIPLGFGYSDSVFFGDSGVIELILRIGLLGLIISYAMVYLNYKKNVLKKGGMLPIFFAVMAFEVGHSILKDLRYFGIIIIVLTVLASINTRKITNKCL